jgi:hypothetical protein
VFVGVIKPSYLWLQEQAKKALESALGGKKDEFEKWNKEIKRREEAGGGGDSGGGGWFGWGGRFGWSNGDNFWPEAQQTSLAVLGIIAMVRFSLFNSCVFAMSLCVINCSPPFS